MGQYEIYRIEYNWVAWLDYLIILHNWLHLTAM